MKKYVFEITIYEGSDEFWESIANQSGCDEVRAELKSLLESGGYYFCDGENSNCDLTLKLFEDKR